MRKAAKAGVEVDLPPLHEWEGAQDIADAFLAAGASEAGGMGETPLSWSELRNCAAMTEIHLNPGGWETLRYMSEEFVGSCSEYREKVVPSPYGGIKQDPANVVDILARALDGLVAGNGKRKAPAKKAG